MKKYLLLLCLLPLLFLTGCASGGGFDMVAFIRNPIIMVIIVIATLYFAFKWKNK